MVKTLLNVIQQVARELAQPVPSEVLADTTSATQQLLALTIAACEELSDIHDWQRLRKVATLTTSAGVAEYALPADYLRMVPNTYWDRTNTRQLAGGLSSPRWAALNDFSSAGTSNFRIIGNKIALYPAPGSTPVSLNFEYVSRFYVQPAGSANPQGEFTSDSDGTVFHDRLLVNFVKLKFLQEQGMNTLAATENFNTSLAVAKVTDTPAPVLSLVGRSGDELPALSNLGGTPTTPIDSGNDGGGSGVGGGGNPTPPPPVVVPVVSIGTPVMSKSSYDTSETLAATVAFATSQGGAFAKSVKLLAVPPGGTHASGPFKELVYQLDQNLPFGTRAYAGTYVFTALDLEGTWEIYASWTDAANNTYEGPSVTVTVAKPVAANVALPLPDSVLGTYFTLWSANNPRITEVPDYYNQIYLFHAVPDVGGAFKFTYGSAVTKEEIATVRARGQRVVLTVGGANAHYRFTTRAESSAFVNSFKQMYTALGVLDGCDFNNFEAGQQSTASEMVWIAQQLKSLYGPDFSITCPPHPGAGFAPNDRVITKAMSDAGVLDFAAPQFYDSTDFASVALIKSLITEWVNHLGDPAKVVIGLGSNYGNGTVALTTAQCVEVYNWARTTYPTIRGVYGWSAQNDRGANWSWGTTMRDVMTGNPVVTTAWTYPTTNSANGWTNPANMLTSNNTYATQVVPTSAEGAGLYVQNFSGLNSGIPANATIVGIEVRVEGFVGPGEMDYSYIYLAQDMAFLPIRSVSSRNIELPTTDGTVIAGGPVDLWGSVSTTNTNVAARQWAAADFGSTFAVYIAFGSTPSGSATINLDSISVRLSWKAA